MLKKRIYPFLIALQFLTLFPVKMAEAPDKNALGQSVLYYPLVGLLIGLVLALLNSLLQHTSELLRAVLLLVSWVIITGALHLDGLADSADAWLGGLGNKQRTLDIMKDPRCGTAAVVSLVSVMMLKLSALYEIESGLELIVVPLLGRLMIPILFLTTPYVRQAGLGTKIVKALPQQSLLCSIIIILFCIAFVLGIKIVLLMAILCIFFLWLRQVMIKRIGGTTGDTAGAMIELTETVSLIFIAW